MRWPYEIVGRDLKLNLEIAIKVLPEALAQDSDRMARFTREAQVPAALVMELVRRRTGNAASPSPHAWTRAKTRCR